MACSPNNAQLRLAPLPPPHLTRSFWYLVSDGTNVEVSLNVLLSEKKDIEDMYAALRDVAGEGEQTSFNVLLDVLQTRGRESGVMREVLQHIAAPLT